MTTMEPGDLEPSANTKITRRGWVFLAAMGVSIAGSAWGWLDATSVAVLDGGPEQGTIYAGLFVSVGLVFSAIAVPLVPRVCRMLGESGAYSLARWGMVVSSVVVGLVILAGFADERALLVYAPFYGVFVGQALVLNPLFARRTMGAAGMARTYARLSVVGGLAWALGALAGGWITERTASGWGLIAMGIAAIPLALVVIHGTGDKAAKDQEAVTGASNQSEGLSKSRGPNGLRSSWVTLRANPALLNITVFAAVIAICISPLVSLIVPIAEELYPREFIASASIMMAGLSLGEMLTPTIVNVLKKWFDDQRAAAVAALACGLLLIVFSLDALIFTGNVELAFWILLSLAFGGARYASRALALGAAASSRPGHGEVSTMSVYFLAVMVTAPIGALVWSLIIEEVNVVSALLVGAAGTIAVSLWLLRRPKLSSP